MWSITDIQAWLREVEVRLNKLLFPMICLVLLVMPGFLSCVVHAPAAPVNPVPPIASPASNVPDVRFELGTMVVTPGEVQTGTPVRADVPAKNTGGTRNAYVGTLYLDGQEYGRQDITLPPGGSGTLTFQLPDLDQGNHTLTVGNSQGSVRVYSVERYSLTNNQVYVPHYGPIDYTPPPPLPYTSVDTFTPPVTPFYITGISFRYPFPQSFKILDSAGKELFSTDIAYNEGSAVPNIQVNGPFSVQMQTSRTAADIRSQFFSFNSVSFVIAYFWPEVSSVDGVQRRYSQ
jgi:hypothetical protein